MFEVKPQPATTDQIAMIQRLQQRLTAANAFPPMTGFQQLNKDAVTDHRVELSFQAACDMVNVLQVAKNKHYDNSYSKRGIYSIFFNMERKWERLIGQLFGNTPVAGESQEGDPLEAASESFMDTCVDLAAYSMKLVAWMSVRRPDLYIKVLQYVEAESISVGILTTDAALPFTPPGEVQFFQGTDTGSGDSQTEYSEHRFDGLPGVDNNKCFICHETLTNGNHK